MEKIFEGVCEKMFCLINTTEYNNDGTYCVQVVSQNELINVGFDNGINTNISIRGREYPIALMDVNDVAETDDYGCLLIRIA